MLYPLLLEPQENSMLIPLVKHISQEKIDRFAVVTEGVGAIHVDPKFADKTVFKSTIAHGFLFVAYVSEMMQNNFGLPWLEAGDLEMKNVGPAKPGDSLLISGRVKKIDTMGPNQKITCEFQIENQKREKVVIGEATVTCAM